MDDLKELPFYLTEDGLCLALDWGYFSDYRWIPDLLISYGDLDHYLKIDRPSPTAF